MPDNESYLSASQVCRRYNISDMTLWRWLKDEKLAFPQPMTIRRRRRFREADLVTWERARARVA
jgi:excisionase family DNA binding protein